MKNFIKDNWFKLSAIFVLVIIGLSMSYYFAFFLPRNNTHNDLRNFTFQKEKECKDECSKIFLKESTECPKCNFFNPIYNYNSRLNTCLYSGGLLDEKYSEKFVRDCFSNKDVIRWSEFDGKPILYDTEALDNKTFEEQKNKLMGE